MSTTTVPSSPEPRNTETTGSSNPSDPTTPHQLQPMPLDLASPQLTLRALSSGVLLAFVLSACNIYLGLKIGWTINMSLTASLLAYGSWSLVGVVFRTRRFGLLENNINQTTASAGASVSSAGLVAPIPALTMLTGQVLDWHFLVVWVFSVCLVGIAVAIGLRRQMIIHEKLPFAVGIATAEMLRELYSRGTEALRRVTALVIAALFAVPLLLASQFHFPFLPGKLPGVVAPSIALQGYSGKALTFGLNTTPLMYAVGGLVGLRACISLVVGALFAWAFLAPTLIHSGHLRLEVAEALPNLPAGVVLAREPDGYVRYDDNSRQLIGKGVMTPAERDALLAQSDDVFYGEAVLKLFVRSQREHGAPLAALPPGVVLPPGSGLEYDAQERVLRARRGIDTPTFEALRSATADVEFHAALTRLYQEFQLNTTRRIPLSERLPEPPGGFVLPRSLAGKLRIDAAHAALISTGPLTDGDVTRLHDALAAHLRHYPNQRDAVARFAAALDRLVARSADDELPAGFAIPEPLARRVRYIPELQALRVVGTLAPAEARQLEALVPQDSPRHLDYRTTISDLAAGARFVRAEPTFNTLISWLMWPGVALMVVSSLVSFGFSWRTVLDSFRFRSAAEQVADPGRAADVPRNWFIAALIGALLLSVALQVSFFAIVWWAAVAGVLLSFLLAIVAGRVAGETNITPVGAMGKVTQLVFGAILPGRPEPNLMAANVTGGAASQCAELLHDLKCGYLVGASPRLQVCAQIVGAFAGALSGCLVYLVIIPNPSEQLITEEWAAPGVAAWKAVAELFQVGFHAIPSGTPVAMLIASAVGVALAVLEKRAPALWRPYLPSPASLGLAFVIPASTSITMLTGALGAYVLTRAFKRWSARFLIAITAGLIAGESLSGVGVALSKIEWTGLLGRLIQAP